MKKIYCILLFGAIVVVSCKKNNVIGTDNGCITRIRAHNIGGADSLAAAKLLQQNNIPNGNLGFERVILNDTITNILGSTVYQHVFALQYFNGLQLFNSDMGYHFKGGVLQSSSGTRYSSINLNTVPSLSLLQVRKLYVDELSKDTYKAVLTYKDSCLVAEFGYFNLNTTGTATDFVKVWRVSPKNSSYPQAFFLDNTGSTLSYFNGLETVN